MPEILIVNFNPALDRTAIVERYNPYGMNKAEELIVLPGGKGVNLGRALKTLGYTDFICSGIIGGNIGKLYKSLLDREGIPSDFFWIEDETRIAYATYERSTGIGIITNEQGPKVTREEIIGFMEFIIDKYITTNIIVLSGGSPPSISSEDIRNLLEIFKERNKQIFIDTSGNTLKLCSTLGPYCIKVNEDELKGAFNIDIEEKDTIKEFYLSLAKLGTRWLIVTRGEKGAVFIGEDRVLIGRNKNVYSHYSIGSGDAFLAGILYGYIKGFSLRELLSLAISCGSANTLYFGACIFTMDDVNRMKEEIIIEESYL